MKEYTYEVEHSWEKQRRPVTVDHQNRNQHRHHRQHHCRHSRREDAAMDADASSMSGQYKYLYSLCLFKAPMVSYSQVNRLDWYRLRENINKEQKKRERR